MASVWLTGGGPYDSKGRDLVLYQEPAEDQLVFESGQGKPRAVYERTSEYRDTIRHGRCVIFRYSPLESSQADNARK